MVPTIKDLMDAFYYTVVGRWEHIGIHLYLPMPTLKEIDAEHQHDPHKSLIRMLELCLNRVHPPPTQTVIVDTVKFLGEK